MNGPAATAPIMVHHVAVETGDVENSSGWYQAFLGCTVEWSLEQFSSQTMERLPGIRRLVELRHGPVRFHLMEREGCRPPAPVDPGARFQHVCLAVSSTSELEQARRRWIDLFDSGRFRFARAEQPTEIAVDATSGSHGFYAFDVDGLEFEVAWYPELDHG